MIKFLLLRRLSLCLLLIGLTTFCNKETPTPTTYTLRFETDGGTDISNQSIIEGNSVKTPLTPSREGYTFEGWYKDTNFEQVFNFEIDTITKDTTIYAKWNALTYVIRFETNGGNVKPNIILEGRVRLTAEETTSPEREDFTFQGWYRDIGLSTAFDYKVDRISSDTTLYAKWIDEVFTVTFDTLGGSIIEPKNVVTKNNIQQPADPTKKNEFFIGWYADNARTIRFDFDQEITRDTTIYAKWATEVFYIIFDMDGASAIPKQIVPGGEVLRLNDVPTPIREDYTFQGWYSQSNRVVRYPFGAETTKVTSDVTLYAKWASSKKEITVFEFERSKNSKLVQDLRGTINGFSVEVNVPVGTDISSLTPTVTHEGIRIFTSQDNMEIDPNTFAQDYSAIRSYTIIAEDETQRSYSIVVRIPSAKDMTIFGFDTRDNPTLNNNVIIQNPETYFVVNLDGADPTSLTARIGHNGKNYRITNQNGENLDDSSPIDFSNPITYTINAIDGSTKEYTVIIQNNSSKQILSFEFAMADNPSLTADIIGRITSNDINIAVPVDTNISMLTPKIFHSGVNISPTGRQDFSKNIAYTVSAQDGSTQIYNVTVKDQSTVKEISSFELKSFNHLALNYNIEGDIQLENGQYVIYLDIPFCLQLDVTLLKPTIVFEGSSISPSGETEQSFTSPVNYTVTAQDGSVVSYRVQVRSGGTYQNLENSTVQSILSQSGIQPAGNINYVHVKANAPTGNCGADWDNAISGEELKSFLDNIQDASANNYYVILVAKGTYFAGNQSSDYFSMYNHVAIIGGWDTASGYDLDPEQYQTIFSGKLGNDSLFDDDAYHIFKNPSNIRNTALLYGVRLQYAYSHGNTEEDQIGGGMYNERNASPTLDHVVFNSNFSEVKGGGLFNDEGASPKLYNVSFEGNYSDDGNGGGIYNAPNTSVYILNATFTDNSAKDNGGAIYNSMGSKMTLINTTFSSNKGNTRGGAIYNENCEIHIINATLTENQSRNGGGIYSFGTTATIINTIIYGNTSGQVVLDGIKNDYTYANSMGESITDSGFNLQDPKLTKLFNNSDGFIRTISLADDSPARNAGIYVREAIGNFYYSENNVNWFINPNLSGNSQTQPANSIELTKTDARGYSRVNQRDIGAYEYGGVSN